ncbi:hypothetical protein LMP49_12670 [Clostridium botulinum]|nr:hypothetical protein [Clostridium botulinum]MCC5427960.1 hypothetical protein [Clostridium botulinum]
MYQGIHFFVTSGKQIKIIINTDEPVWYTLALVFEDFILKYIKDFLSQASYILSKDILLKPNYFNTPELLMIFEQLKYAIRNCDLPYMYYIGKIYEIFAIIIRNLDNEEYLNIPRHNHLSYQNK